MGDICRVMITGTSRGIGKELLKLYSASGYQIIALDDKPDPELPDICSTIIFRHLDITDDSGVENLITDLTANDLLPDIFIFNAAILDVDNEPFIDYAKLRKVLEVNLFSTLKFLSCLLPRLNKPALFVFISSGVVIFPNPANLGYFIGKLAMTRVFDVFADRYASLGFRFKTVILGPIDCGMLRENPVPSGFTSFLREMTTGTPEIAARNIVVFIKSPCRRMYYRRSSAIILWIARFVQAALPYKMKVYRVKAVNTGSTK